MRRLAQQASASQELIEEKLQYLTKRREMIRYEEFVEVGYPIGSGSVESASQLQQARLIQRLQKHPPPLPTPPTAMANEVKMKNAPPPEVTSAKKPSGQDQKPRQKGSRPAPDHPWRKFSFGKGRFRDFTKGSSAKS